MLNMILTYRL